MVPLLEHTGRRSLYVNPGEIVSILGAPGSGKTRLALELAFLVQPEDGEVLLNGQNPIAKRSRLEPTRRPRDVTLLVQNAEDQLFAKTVYDDVAFGPRHLRVDESEIERRVKAALRAVRMVASDVAERSPFALSGGERRRVALAGVLAMEPQVLVLDEPTANLDPQTRNDFVTLLAPLRETSGIAWFTSRVREASLADRIYLLRDGRTQEVSTATDLLANWRELVAAGVELPSVYELADALEHRGMKLPATSSPDQLQEAIVAGWQRRAERC